LCLGNFAILQSQRQKVKGRSRNNCRFAHPFAETGLPSSYPCRDAIAVDRLNKLIRTKGGKYLFNHKALAKVFRGKLLSKLVSKNLSLPQSIPQKWIVNCKKVGSGGKALVYLGRYQGSHTRRWETRTETGAKFLWLVLQHVFPARFRRARNFGFLHPNSKRMLGILKTLGKLDPKKILAKIGLRQRPQMACTCCGGKMQVGRTRIPIAESLRLKQDNQTLVPT